MGDFLKKILYTGATSGIAFRVIEEIKNDYFIYQESSFKKNVKICLQTNVCIV